MYGNSRHGMATNTSHEFAETNFRKTKKDRYKITAIFRFFTEILFTADTNFTANFFYRNLL